jgi:hypothetical protein
VSNRSGVARVQPDPMECKMESVGNYEVTMDLVVHVKLWSTGKSRSAKEWGFLNPLGGEWSNASSSDSHDKKIMTSIL